MQFSMKAIGTISAQRAQPDDDYWGESTATITLAEELEADSLTGLDGFSHAEILYVFDRVAADGVVTGARHPRGNTAWPKLGIFAQRAKNRPNRIGSCIARIVRVSGKQLVVAELDAIDGTPVLDIKPVMREFLPRSSVEQPSWASELMQHYWDVEPR
jgi:tRNA-Thr(GGU) m(6)t(6)A37 methyltransferase TsaA